MQLHRLQWLLAGMSRIGIHELIILLRPITTVEKMQNPDKLFIIGRRLEMVCNSRTIL